MLAILSFGGLWLKKGSGLSGDSGVWGTGLSGSWGLENEDRPVGWVVQGCLLLGDTGRGNPSNFWG